VISLLLSFILSLVHPTPLGPDTTPAPTGIPAPAGAETPTAALYAGPPASEIFPLWDNSGLGLPSGPAADHAVVRMGAEDPLDPWPGIYRMFVTDPPGAALPERNRPPAFHDPGDRP